MAEVITGYMDMVDWQHELGEAPGGARVYASIDDLKEHNTCWNGCGIVEVTVSLVRVVEPQDLSR